MSDYVFGCPKCNREFRVLPEFADEVIKCPHCAQKLRIPSAYFPSYPAPLNSLSRDERESPQSTSESNQDNKSKTNAVVPKEPKTDTRRLPPKENLSEEAKGEHGVSSLVRADPQTTGADANQLLTGSEKSVEQSSPQERTSSGSAAQLPPQFVAPWPSKPKPAQVVGPSTDIAAKTKASIASTEKSNAGASGFSSAEMESATVESGFATGLDNASSNQPAATSAAEEQPSISHLLPPQFAVLDPSRFKRQSGFDNHVLLPTADGGVQTVSDRLVTIEYKGEKYIVVAMSREEKRRRQFITNIFSVIVAIGAIVGTIWILMK